MPEVRRGLIEAHALVHRALANEVVEEGHTLGSKVAHAATGDSEEVVVDLLHAMLEVIVLLLPRVSAALFR